MNRATIENFAVIVPAYKASGTIADCLQAILSSTRKPTEVIVYYDGLTDNVAPAPNVRVIANPGAPVGPARGRNTAARESNCDVLIFVDADVIVAKDAFRLLLEEIESDPQIWAAFGSYDQTPHVTRRAALYANLRHHWVHQNGEREAVTFWSGIGAVRRDVFWAIEGFDESAFLEDIELGARLKRRGGRIRLVPEAQGTHCKDWTVAQLWRTDIFGRAIPWAQLLVSGACVGGHLNGTARERRSAVIAYLCLTTLTGCFLSAWFGIGFMFFGFVYVYLNRGLFRLLLRRGGVARLITGVMLHWSYHLYSSTIYVAVKLGLLPPYRERPVPCLRYNPPLAPDAARSAEISDD